MFQKDTNITILGDGGWGTTLSIGLAEQGFEPILWGAFPLYVDEIRKKKENTKFLPGFKIPDKVRFCSDIHEACEHADIIVLASPSQHIRSVLRKLNKEKVQNKKFVCVAKGIETPALKVMSQVVKEELGAVRLCVLSGPSIAKEVALKMPVAVSVASLDKKLASEIRQIFSSDHFSLFETDDMLGVELGGSIKNVIAIGVGIAEGLGYGSNTRAALFARGVAEMARLGLKMGASRQTFMGLSGLGDLATTCLSPDSRNRTLGEQIGKGKSLQKLLNETEMVVEGVDTCKSVEALARKHKVAMPISSAVYRILFNKAKPTEIVKALMQDKSYRELD